MGPVGSFGRIENIKRQSLKYTLPVNFRLDGTPYLKVPKSSAEKIDNKTAEIIEIFEEDSYIE